jgi:regulator of sirC expression with transglutaminase-like and TPR domain
MDLDAALDRLGHDPSSPCDVARIALHLSRDEFPDLDVCRYLRRLNNLGRRVRASFAGGLEQRVLMLTTMLFDDLRFRGNVQDYYDPENSYLHRVMERRVGLPITLSMLAMAVGERAGLEVVGVGLPGHFIAKAVDGGKEVLFDPFHGGLALTPADCEQLVRQVTGQPFHATPAMLAATPPGLIVRRLLVNLKGAYLRRGDFTRMVPVIERLLQLDRDDADQTRDLGVCLLHAGQPGRAIDLLEGYLGREPDGPDVEKVQGLLRQARGEVARWN